MVANSPPTMSPVQPVGIGGLRWRRWPLYAIGILIASTPIGLQVVPGIPLSFKVVQVASLAVIAATVVGRTLSGLVPLQIAGTNSWTVALLGSALLSSMWAVNASVTNRTLILYVIAVLLAIAIASGLKEIADIRAACCLLAVVGGAVCLQGVLASGIPKAEFGAQVVVNRSLGIFSQPNEFGSFSDLIFIIALSQAVHCRRWWSRSLLGTSCVAAAAALFLSLSRGAFIGAALGLVFLMALDPRVRRFLHVVLPVAIPLAALVIPTASTSSTLGVLRARVATIASSAAGPQDERPAIWREALRQFDQSPIVGVGPGDYPYAALTEPNPEFTVLPDVASPTPELFARGPYHAHNLFLTTAAETGLIGLLALLGLATSLSLSTLVRIRARMNAATHFVSSGLLAALATVAGQGLVDDVYRNALLLMLVWLVIGLLIAANAADE